MHVDDFIDQAFGHENYARFFFLLHRLPAALKADFDEWIRPHKLFCTWKDQRWRVTGASRLGDVWLASDFNREIGYDKRVDLKECSEWGADPEGAKHVLPKL